MVVRRGGKGGGDTEPRERQPGNRLPSRRHTTVDTDGYDISEVRGHLRFILSFVLHAAQLCPPLRAPLLRRRPPFTLPFISIRFFCRSCSLIISFCSSLAHVTFSLSLSLSSPLPPPALLLSSCLARRFYFSLSKPGLSGPSAEGRLLFLSTTPRSCFYFLSAFLPPLFRPRSTAAPLSLVVLASSSKLNALSKSILSLDTFSILIWFFGREERIHHRFEIWKIYLFRIFDWDVYIYI